MNLAEKIKHGDSYISDSMDKYIDKCVVGEVLRLLAGIGSVEHTIWNAVDDEVDYEIS